MKDEAAIARNKRLRAAQRLIEHVQHPEHIAPKKQKKTIRMVEPVELAIKVVTT